MDQILEEWPDFLYESPCAQHIQFALLHAEQQNMTDLFMAEPHFYSDIGRAAQCEYLGGSYIQVMLGITDMPTRVPLGMCLPAECNS